MASENFPVIIRCQDTNVAVPIKTLIHESTVFMALYESFETKRWLLYFFEYVNSLSTFLGGTVYLT